MKLKKILSIAILLSSILWAGETNQTPVSIKVISEMEKPNYFLSISGGHSKGNIKTNIDLATTKRVGNNTDGSYIDAGFGYYIDYNMFITANIANIDLYAMDITNIYGSVNYEPYRYKRIKTFMGVLAGYSTLKWDIYPLSNVISSKDKSSSPFWGVQAGLSYDIKDHLELAVKAQFFKFYHKTLINKASINSSIHKYDSAVTTTIGIRYLF